MSKSKAKITIGRLIRVTPGGMHGWYEAKVTDKGRTTTIQVRKQLIHTSTTSRVTA